jgi:hypothetical protein
MVLQQDPALKLLGSWSVESVHPAWPGPAPANPRQPDARRGAGACPQTTRKASIVAVASSPLVTLVNLLAHNPCRDDLRRGPAPVRLL